MTILVTGATGNVGSAVLTLLRSQGLPARAGIRRPAHNSVSGEAVAFDFLEPATWEPAFEGIDLLFLVRPPALSNVERDIVPALEAAKLAGVSHIVFLSLQGAGTNRIVPHAKIEAWLQESGLFWTFLRPSFFMQNLSTTHVAEIRDRSEIIVPAGQGRTAFVDVEDVAAVALAVFRAPWEHRNRAWTLTGPTADTYTEVAELLSSELGRPIRYRRPGLLRFARHARTELRMPWAMVAVMAVIYTTARIGKAAGLTDDVEKVTGRPPATLADFVHRERSVWIPGHAQKAAEPSAG